MSTTTVSIQGRDLGISYDKFPSYIPEKLLIDVTPNLPKVLQGNGATLFNRAHDLQTLQGRLKDSTDHKLRNQILTCLSVAMTVFWIGVVCAGFALSPLGLGLPFAIAFIFFQIIVSGNTKDIVQKNGPWHLDNPNLKLSPCRKIMILAAMTFAGLPFLNYATESRKKALKVEIVKAEEEILDATRYFKANRAQLQTISTRNLTQTLASLSQQPLDNAGPALRKTYIDLLFYNGIKELDQLTTRVESAGLV